MNRPPLEVADIVRCAGRSFIERSRKWINGQHGNGLRYCHSAFGCSSHPISQQQTPLRPRCPFTRRGNAALRRNHACCRAPLCRPTPPPISASSHPVRRLNPHLQPRISLLLRRAHWFYVSHSSECSMVVRSRLSDVPVYDHSLCHQQLKRKRTDSKRHLANDNDRLIEKQTP